MTASACFSPHILGTTGTPQESDGASLTLWRGDPSIIAGQEQCLGLRHLCELGFCLVL